MGGVCARVGRVARVFGKGWVVESNYKGSKTKKKDIGATGEDKQ